MANTLYPAAKAAFMRGEIHWDTDDIKACLVSYAYTYSAAHVVLSELIGGADPRIGSPISLSAKTYALGQADAADVIFTAVTGAVAAFIVLYKDTGNTTTSPLVAFIDTATGLPATPTGANITVVWDSGGNRIFHI